MKTKFLILVLVVFLSACATFPATQRNWSDLTQFMVGTWQGSTYYPDEQVYYEWRVEFRKDGTYVLRSANYFVKGVKQDDKTEKGKWWVEGNKVFQIIPGLMEKPDIYELTILSDDITITHVVDLDETTLYSPKGKYFWEKRGN